MRIAHVVSLSLLLLVSTTVASAQIDSLGRIAFPNSGSPEAQESFVRGVLLLHSFEYEDAREAFREARNIDPDFALACWGEAMTHNHPLWRQQDIEAGRAALYQFAATPAARLAKTPTERERLWIEAVDTLYGEGDKVERDLAYSEKMAALSARYPDDQEARAFHALSILGTAQGNRDFRVYMRAGAVAEEVFATNPLHPGAAHYMIHSYDDPIHAPLGLRAARVYAQIAPAASHAQHMISHIYVALGQWADSVEANVNAVDVSVERRARRDLGPDAVSYHALHWLEYSYLQLRRWEEARETLDAMTRYAEESGSATALWHHAAMRATWLVETGGLEAPEEIRPDEAQLTGRAASLFADGYAALRRGDRDGAIAAAERLSGALEGAVATHCSTSAGYGAISEGDLDVAGVMRTSLLAAIELDAGNEERALELIDKAVASEVAMPLEYGPPSIVKPSTELRGEMLLSLNRPEEARKSFELALERAPRRVLSLTGLATAALAMGDQATTDDACEELIDIHSNADEDLDVPEICSRRGTAASSM